MLELDWVDIFRLVEPVLELSHTESQSRSMFEKRLLEQSMSENKSGTSVSSPLKSSLVNSIFAKRSLGSRGARVFALSWVVMHPISVEVFEVGGLIV